MQDEIHSYLAELDSLKKQIRGATEGLNDEAANWHPLPKDTNSIYAILSHLVGSDNFWVRQIIGAQTFKRDRDAEFRASGRLSEILDFWQRISKENEEILRKLNSSRLSETRTLPSRPDRGLVTIRWCILRLISHYGIHLGHIQLTRQMWEQR